MLLADAVVESHEGLVGRAYPKAVRACGAQLGADTAAVPDACRRLDVLEGLFHRSASVWPRSRAPRMDSRSRLGPGVAGGRWRKPRRGRPRSPPRRARERHASASAVTAPTGARPLVVEPGEGTGEAATLTGVRSDLNPPHPLCRKRSFATQADRLRPRLNDRQLPAAAGVDDAANRPGLDRLPAAPEEGQRAHGLWRLGRLLDLEEQRRPTQRLTC